MSKLTYLLFSVSYIFIVLLLLFTPATIAAIRIGVIDFMDHSRYSEAESNLSQDAADILSKQLNKYKNLTVIKRQHIKNTLEEHRDILDCSDYKNAPTKIGRFINADYILVGTINTFDPTDEKQNTYISLGRSFSSKVTAKAIHVPTGITVFIDSQRSKKFSYELRVFSFGISQKNNEKKEQKALKKALSKIAKRLANTEIELNLATTNHRNIKPEEFMIVNIDGPNVIINKGQNAGFYPGQTYAVKQYQNPVKNPTTGKIIAFKYKDTGNVKIQSVFKTYSEGRILTDNGISQGDVLVLNNQQQFSF